MNYAVKFHSDPLINFATADPGEPLEDPNKSQQTVLMWVKIVSINV